VVKSKDALGVLEGQSVMDLFFFLFFCHERPELLEQMIDGVKRCQH